MLVSTRCAGPCEHGPVVALDSGRHDGRTLQVTTGSVLGPVGATQVGALAELVQQPSDAALPPALDVVRRWGTKKP